MKMHRMWLIDWVLQHKAHCPVGAVVVNAANWSEIEISKLRLQQKRVVVVDSESLIVHVPQQGRAV